jgi:beta-phosphoglucomutase
LKSDKSQNITAVIFDLDGVIVSTDEYHYQGWQRLADEEGISFDRTVNERLRGVSRMDSLEILLEKSSRKYSLAEKLELADRKNTYYRAFLQQVTPADILPGIMDFLVQLKECGLKVAVASSSKNTPLILERIGMSDYFDTVVDGNDIRRSKPDPEVFLLAAQQLQVPPERCLVLEDAVAGIEAALAGNMRVIGVGFASSDPRATGSAPVTSDLTLEMLESIGAIYGKQS